MIRNVSVSEAADRLSVSEDTVRRHAPLIKFGRRVLISEDWIDHLDAVPAPEFAATTQRPTPPTRRTFDF